MEVSLRYIKVLEFATIAHEGQKRKYTDDDYIIHPIAVARLVQAQDGDDNMVYAALLHDVLEDTSINHTQMRTMLHNILSIEAAEDVLSLVVELTDVFTKEAFPEYNRDSRKQFEALRLAYVSDRAKAIKRADIEHNSESILDHDPKFAKVFLKEKKNLLSKMSLKVAITK
tara:strand:+ start:222 stop:734 length:513 start_codon:yes stop_codon:yes gene_type:complete